MITAMNSGAGGSSWTFGRGGGCFTNATVSATGSGTFVLGAESSNSIGVHVGAAYAEGSSASPLWTINGDGTLGSAYLTMTAGYSDGFYLQNYSLSGN